MRIVLPRSVRGKELFEILNKCARAIFGQNTVTLKVEKGYGGTSFEDFVSGHVRVSFPFLEGTKHIEEGFWIFKTKRIETPGISIELVDQNEEDFWHDKEYTEVNCVMMVHHQTGPSPDDDGGVMSVRLDQSRNEYQVALRVKFEQFAPMVYEEINKLP